MGAWAAALGLAALITAAGVSAAKAAESAPLFTLPLFTAASNENQQGFARIVNHSDEAGTVRIYGIDDTGDRDGPVTLSLEARATAHFNSGDLEAGNASKGLSGRLGDGEGDWRLELYTELDIEPLAYIRTRDGFVTTMHEVVPETAAGYHVRFFNPGRNRAQRSRLRLINPTDQDVAVTIRGIDDAGEAPPEGEVELDLPAGSARTVTAQELESGRGGLGGSFGDGTGKWQLFVTADGAIEVMSLLQSPTGHLSNLSAAGLPGIAGGRAREFTFPLFTAASNENQQGFARIINRSDESGTVRIHGIDDEGERYGPIILSLDPRETVHFNSGDLERGNPSKGLSGELGDEGEGDWRLELSTALDIEPLAYIRTADGFVTAMHEVVPESAMRHHVPFFNPGRNRSQRSRLRLINPGDESVRVTIRGRDDAGEAPPGGEVGLTLAAGAARTVTAEELESGGTGLSGSFGEGTGKWQLFLTADSAVEVMNLLESPTGHLSNLSGSGLREVVTEGGVGQPVALKIVVVIPAEVMSVRVSDVTTRALGSETADVPAGKAPTLLLASDEGGTVMMSLANEDGGFLGEAPGEASVSVASTAVTLVAMAAGYRIPAIDQGIVDRIVLHASFGELTTQLTRLMSVDKNYLDRLYDDYPEVVALIKRMAEAIRPGATTASALARSLARDQRKTAKSTLPEGIRKEDFWCTPVIRAPCSPWGEHEPWRWFGDAKGFNAYYPDNRYDAIRLLLSIQDSVVPGLGPAAYLASEAYVDLLTEATHPPFLARSESSTRVHAMANPNFINYAMEIYKGSERKYYGIAPRNSTILQKLLASGAAYHEIDTGDTELLNPEVERIRFQRYRLKWSTVGGWTPDHAAMISALNALHVVVSVANLFSDIGVVSKWLERVALVAKTKTVVSCLTPLIDKVDLRFDPNATEIEEQMAGFFAKNATRLIGKLKEVLNAPSCQALLVETGWTLAELALEGALRKTADVVLMIGTGGAKAAFDAANDAVPVFTSYLAPGASGADYFIQWERSRDGQPYIAAVTEQPLPAAEFEYRQQDGFRVELDGSKSTGDDLTFEWRMAGQRIGTGRRVVHDFGRAGTFDVTLTVTDRRDQSVALSARVEVTVGRAPVVSSLTCSRTGSGKAFSMQANYSDPDGDIQSVEWFGSVSNANPDQVTGAGQSAVTLSAPSDAAFAWAMVNVVDSRGNRASRRCLVEFERPEPPPVRPGGETLYFNDEGELDAIIVNFNDEDCQFRQVQRTVTVPPGKKWTRIKFAASRGDVVLLVDDGERPSKSGPASHQCETGYAQDFDADKVYDWAGGARIFRWTKDLMPGDTLRLALFSYEGGVEDYGITVDVDSEDVSVGPPTAALASYGKFHVIAHELSEDQDHDAECRSQLGSGFRLADWNDIVSYHEGGGSLTEFTARLRMSVEGRDRLPGEISSGYRISSNGNPIWSGNRPQGRSRHYFYARHDHHRPGYFLAHANIDNYHLTLGSWYGTGGHALCYEPGGHSVGEVFRDCAECPEMVVIPAGSFRMGCLNDSFELSDRTRCDDDEFPVHDVDVPRFALAKYEVTFEEWDACVAAGGCRGYRPSDEGWGRAARPAINVSWNDAQEFAAWLTQETGAEYRLPSESEFEYAARAGTENLFSWGDDLGVNRANCATDCGDEFANTAPVGSFEANPFGLYDMHGNVYEWVVDCLHATYNDAPSDGSAWENDNCARQVARSGSWRWEAGTIRSANRAAWNRGSRSSFVGLRVARTLSAGGVSVPTNTANK